MGQDDLRRIGDEAYDRGDYKKAIECLRKLYYRHVDDEFFLNRLATAYFRTGDFENAMGFYLSCVELNGNNPLNWLNWGLALAKLGQTDRALDEIAWSLCLDPENDFAWEQLGNLYEAAQKLPEALYCYQRIRGDKISNEIAARVREWESRGISPKISAALEKAQFQPAKKTKRGTRSQKPRVTDVGTFIFQANDALHSGNSKKAVKILEKVLAKDSRNCEAWCILAMCLGKQNNFKSALLALDEAAVLNPSFGATYYGYGIIYHAIGSLGVAMQAFDQGARLGDSLCKQAFEEIQRRLKGTMEEESIYRTLSNPWEWRKDCINHRGGVIDEKMVGVSLAPALKHALPVTIPPRNCTTCKLFCKGSPECESNGYCFWFSRDPRFCEGCLEWHGYCWRYHPQCRKH